MGEGASNGPRHNAAQSSGDHRKDDAYNVGKPSYEKDVKEKDFTKIKRE